MTHRKLSLKQRKFCDSYMGVSNGNATDAARKAGYSGSDTQLAVVGSNNLRKANIQAYLTAAQDNDPLVLGRVEIQQLLTRVATGEELEDGEPPKMRDRLNAISLLCKTGGYFVQKIEAEVTSKVIEYDLSFTSRDDGDE